MRYRVPHRSAAAQAGLTPVLAKKEATMRFAHQLMALVAAIPLLSFAYTNEPAGFRGISWGSKYSDLAGLSVTEKTGNIWMAEKKDEQMSIGAATLSQVSYIFTDEKFTSVVVVTNTLANNQALLDALNSQFGTPERPNRFMDKYFWRGNVTTISMQCERSLSGQCATYFISSQQMKVENDASAEKTRNSGKDF